MTPSRALLSASRRATPRDLGWSAVPPGPASRYYTEAVLEIAATVPRWWAMAKAQLVALQFELAISMAASDRGRL